MTLPEFPSGHSAAQHHVNRRTLLQIAGSAVAGALTTGAGLPALTELVAAPALASAAALPNDRRLGPLKELNSYFPFTPSATPAEWEKRKEYVRRQILVSTGLWPMPARPAVKPVIHGRVERDGYTVDRVYFESSPGFLVTGSLYLPSGKTGKLPTILCPHGHWPQGRFHDHGPEQIKKEIESGGEQYEVGGRHPLQARCVQLARMGCMVFLYDMLGYADGGSLSEDLAHRFNKQRPHMITPEHWGLFSAQSELRLVNILGLQTWNSVRVLDWLSSREDCDTTRIGVTGASGGGTQTFLLTAIDDRVTAAFPAVMVSTAMQGGCTCENATYLRVNSGNIEFAAMAAPRPLAMTGANDWTKEIETKGLPELKQHYAMLGVPDLVAAKHYAFPHNYNWPSRMMMYRFFNKYLNLGFAEDAITEQDYVPLTREEATVFNDAHPAPPKDEASEIAFLQLWDKQSNDQMHSLLPKDQATLHEFYNVVGGALQVMIGRGLTAKEDIAYEKLTEEERDGYLQYSARLNVPKYGEDVPAAFLYPSQWNKQVVLWIDGDGKSKLYQADGKPIAAVAQLLKAGYAIGSVDLLYTGEYTEDGKTVSTARSVPSPREFAGFTLGYNHPLFSQRVHDVLTLISFAAQHDEAPTMIHLVGINGAGPIAAAAAAVSDCAILAAAIDTKGFRFGTITDIRDVNLLPGAVKYGDLPSILALCAPRKLLVIGETAETLDVAQAAYAARGKTAGTLTTGKSVDEIPNWIAQSK